MGKRPDPDLFGTIKNDPPAMFPYRSGRDGIPFPQTPDPFGAAKASLEFLAEFEIPEGRRAGQRIEGKNLPPFIRRAIVALVGYRDPETATRYIRRAMFLAPRKSMKSYLAALVAIIFLFSRQERAGEILIVASSQKQARRIFELTCAILRSNPRYWQQLRVQDVQSKLTHLETRTTVSALPADPAKLYGLSPSVLLLDELHVWTGSKGQKLWNSLTTGQGARANPLILSCTTVSDEPLREGDILLDEWRYATKVSSGAIDDRRYLPMLWVCPEDEDIHDPTVWKRYNPGAGYSIDLNEMREEYERAKESDTGLAGFRSMRLNQFPTSSLNRGWFSPASLEKITSAIDREAMLDHARCAIGIDYGGSFDLASVVVVTEDEAGEMYAIQRSWICRAGYDRIRKECPEVADMVERGELTVSGDEAVSAETVVAEVADIAAYFAQDEIALDPAMSQHLAPLLTDVGLDLVEARQGALSMAAPMQALEEVVAEGRFNIGEDHLFRWCLGNTGQVTSSWGRKPAKIGYDSSANPRKIDATSALLSAIQLIQEQRNTFGVSGDDGIDWICPWTTPADARAVQEGGVAVGSWVIAGEQQRHPQTGAWIVHHG